MNKPAIQKLVTVTDQGVKFGNAWFSHEHITGYTAEQLNSGNCRIAGKAYMEWFAAPVLQQNGAVVEYGKTPGCKGCDRAEKNDSPYCNECSAELRPYREVPIPVMHLTKSPCPDCQALGDICKTCAYWLDPEPLAWVYRKENGDIDLKWSAKDYEPGGRLTPGVKLYAPLPELDVLLTTCANQSRRIYQLEVDQRAQLKDFNSERDSWGWMIATLLAQLASLHQDMETIAAKRVPVSLPISEFASAAIANAFNAKPEPKSASGIKTIIDVLKGEV